MNAIALERSPLWKCRSAYIVLSLLSGLLELGVVLAGARAGLPLTWLLVVALFYQLGVLAAGVTTVGVTWVQTICLIATVVAAADHNAAMTATAVCLISFAIHRLRSMSKANARVGTTGKRIARVAGFILAAGFSGSALAMVGIMTGLLTFLVPQVAEGRRVVPSRVRPIDAAMVAHQAHYFAYAYVVPVVLLSLTGFNMLASAAAFSAGWMSYTAAPALLGSLPTRRVVVIGHVAVAVVLLLMSQTATGHSSIPFMFLWFLSGFGGGTVFGIRRLAEPDPQGSSTDTWEDVGHLAGVTVALGVTALGASPTALFTASAVLALITALLIAVMISDDRLENSRHIRGTAASVAGSYDTAECERRSA